MADLADLEWRFIPEAARPGPVQMALEEVAAETAVAGGPALVRVFRWEPSTLSLGYRQDPATVDWAACDRLGVDVTRRQTGGGGIYHDHEADLSYSIVVPAAAVPGDLLESYRRLCRPILAFFDDLGMDADFAASERPPVHQPACFLRAIHPAHDILVGDRKVSGNAQYRRRDAVIQHGSVNASLVPARHLAVFADHGVDEATFRERVTAVDEHVDLDRAAVVDRLAAALRSWADADVDRWRAGELEAARELAERKYANDDWIRRKPASSTG
ncbi:MAG: biotin/lipoate A/B protein ligase family protein [Halobacteriales archaeon]